MLYMTLILGLAASWASLAVGMAIFLDAIIDPIMGHISDNTRSRWGRRHPYILIGGALMAVSFFLFWWVPQFFTSTYVLFALVFGINLLIRAMSSVLIIPFTALGFEICPEYESRSRLQGVRFFVNQVVNFTFGALAWTLFFRNSTGADGQVIDGMLVKSNYVRMGFTLALAIAGLSAICCWGTRKHAVDNRSSTVSKNNLREFWADFTSIFKDKLAVLVFIFFIVAQFSMMLMGTIQMFTYVFYMQFSAIEKTCVHGAGMLAFAFASLNLSKVVKRLDKKGAGYTGIALAIFGGLGLMSVFSGGLIVPGQTLQLFGITLPLATIVFGLLQVCWWGGCGMVVPLASSMVADAAAINHKKTGVLKNASYAAVFSFSTKAAGSVGMFLTGVLVDLAGIVPGSKVQTTDAVHNIALMTFLCGPIVILCAMLILRRYPVTREFMQQFDR
jgi:GPH family glycoside/pentoside/hexuronide:cation symporter